MRKFGRIDSNHGKIVEALRRTGHSVVSLASVGGGCPDLLVGRNGINVLLEIKDGEQSPSRCKLTPDEVQFFETWKGQVAVVYNPETALCIVNEKLKRFGV